MKQCFFSNADLKDFKWKYGPEYVCYPCYARHSNEDLVHELEHSLRAEGILIASAMHQQKKKKSRRKSDRPKIKVDRRMVDATLPPSLPGHVLPSSVLRFPQAEGLRYPKIRYPYLTSFLAST